MAKLSVWLHAGTIIPTGTTTGLTAGTVTQDGYCELSGSETQIQSDYENITGYALPPNSFNSSATVIGSGSLFGGGHDGMR